MASLGEVARAALASRQKWDVAKRGESGVDIVRWVPLVEIAEQKTVGLSEAAEWVVCATQTVVQIDEASAVDALPILEFKRLDFERRLDAALVANALPVALRLTFPFEFIVMVALDAGSEYWVERGLEWVDPTEVTGRLRDTLWRIARGGSFHQRIRHRARRLARV